MAYPTVNNDDQYTLGNDYPQAPISAFYDLGTSGENYQDGIFTKIASGLSGWKDPNGFNKRTVLINPSASYEDEDYSQADVIFNVGADVITTGTVVDTETTADTQTTTE